MRSSVWLSAAQTWPEMLDLATHADAGFWRSVYVADHFMRDGNSRVGAAGMLEATATLAALGAATTRIRLANLVLSITYRHPAVLANWAASVDHISNGRLTLGVGAGWQINEHQQYGLALGRRGERVDRFAEGLAVLTGLLTTPTTTVAGRYFQVTEAECEPKPMQTPLPLLIGASGPRMLRLVARYAHEWNQWSVPGEFHRTSEALDAACEREDRDPSTVWRSTQALTILTDSPEAEARAEATAAKSVVPVIHGSPARIVDAVARWRDEGVDEVIIPDWALPSGSRRRDAFDALAAALAPLADHVPRQVPTGGADSVKLARNSRQSSLQLGNRKPL